jgi:hypothetical protein
VRTNAARFSSRRTLAIIDVLKPAAIGGALVRHPDRTILVLIFG